MLYYGQIKLDWQCEPFLWLPAVCSSASAPQGTLFVQPAHHSVCTWSLSAAPHLPYIHDDILRLLHPIPSLAHSQCLSMNGSDIMNNSRRTGRPISYWSFRPLPSCAAAAVCHGWRRICLAMDWMVQQTGTGRHTGYIIVVIVCSSSVNICIRTSLWVTFRSRLSLLLDNHVWPTSCYVASHACNI